MTATSGFHAMESEDFVSAGLTFANGAIGTLSATTASFPGRGETITLHFANGSARIDTNLLTIDWQDGRHESFGAATASGAGADPMAFTSDWHRAVICDFAEAIRDGRPPMVPGRAALEVHRLIAALEQSGRAGARVEV
jgi:predicted dehydrogenase